MMYYSGVIAIFGVLLAFSSCKVLEHSNETVIAGGGLPNFQVAGGSTTDSDVGVKFKPPKSCSKRKSTRCRLDKKTCNKMMANSGIITSVISSLLAATGGGFMVYLKLTRRIEPVNQILVDIVFIVDVSHSMRHLTMKYRKALRFASNMVQSYPADADLRVALIKFSEGVVERFGFQSDRAVIARGFLSAEEEEQNIGFVTNTHLGLQSATALFANGRVNAVHVAFLITDGISTEQPEAVICAKELRKIEVKVFVICAIRDDDPHYRREHHTNIITHLRLLASDPRNVSSFDNFPRMIEVEQIFARLQERTFPWQSEMMKFLYLYQQVQHPIAEPAQNRPIAAHH